jgi:hypothetical protein
MSLAKYKFSLRSFMLLWSISSLLLLQPALGENLSRKAALERLRLPDLKLHMERLADDTFEGREAGSRGGNAAAGYIVNRLSQTSFVPAGDEGTYFQSFGDGYRNILAYCEGSDPQLRNEIVLVGAHFDHVGYGSQRNSFGPWGYIHNGADDNASGTAAMLELATNWKALAQRPSRSLLIGFWDAEEKGLLGTKHWCAHPTLDWSRVKCFVNVDMIGRLTNDRLEVYGSRTAAGLRRIVSEANHSNQLRLDFDWTMKEDSDHFPFFQRGLPVLMFHTGLHADYHRPSDDVERLNVPGAEKVTKLLCATALHLAECEKIPEFRALSRRESESTRQAMESSLTPSTPRFGATWSKHIADEGLHLHVNQVVFNSVAHRAGIRPHDVLTHFNGEMITDEQLFRRQLLHATEQVQFRILSGNQTRDLTLELQGKPVRFGISWRPDSAEPGSFLLTNVVYGSPAHEANLKPLDRIYTLNGETLLDSHAFQTALDQATSPIIVQYEREGRIQEATLALPE